MTMPGVNPRAKITNGVDFNHFQRVVVTATDFAEFCDVLIGIRTSYLVLSLINEGSETIEYSFNGNTIHGDLVPGTPSEALSFEGRSAFKIWFKVASGSSTVRVEAYAKQ